MPYRNFVVIVLAAVISVLCYQRAARNRFAGTFAEAMNIVNNEYVEEVDPGKLFEGSMIGMVSQLDRYSGYTPPQGYKQLQEELQGEFGGIGIMVEKHPETKHLMVLGVLLGEPAHEGGVITGDTILEIEGKATAGMSFQDSIDLMRGKPGTKVAIKLQHAGDEKPVSLDLVRDLIPVDSVLGDRRRTDGTWDYRLSEQPDIGYLRVLQFDERTAGDLQAALTELQQGELKGVVIDLRDNAGGLLDSAVEICDMFLDSGVIVSTRGRNGLVRSEISAQPGVKVPNALPVAVLVNQDSASASEIVAACLQDHERAKIVGQRSWGKGTVQHVIDLEGGRRGALRLTVATYWRPSNRNIHKLKSAKDEDDWGVRPDPGLEVSLTNEEAEKLQKLRQQRELPRLDALPKPGAAPEEPTSLLQVDPQLRKAVEALLGKP